MSESIIEIKNLNKKYKNLQAVNNLNLNVYKGDLYGFLGPNGAGKSTTIRMIVSLIFPTSGEVNMFGMSLKQDRRKILSKVGALIEKPDFYNYLSAYKNLEILCKTSGVSADKKRIMKSLEMVGLHNRYDSKVKTFSQGMKQRLGLAQALIHDPDLIILDEPGNGLDPQSTKYLRNLLLDLNQNHGKTIFLSSHILHEIEQMATRMVIINKGQAIVEGKVDDLLNVNSLNVKFDIDEPEKVKSLLSNLNISTQIESETANSLTLTLNKNDIPTVNKYLVENGIAVKAIVPQRALEDYFLNLM